MRVPLVLALLALLATVAGAEEGRETLRTRFQGLVQKAQERLAALQALPVFHQVRELAEAGIERARDAIAQVKSHVSSLLVRSPA